MSESGNVPEAGEVFRLVHIEIDSCYTGRCYKVAVNPNDDVRSIKLVLYGLWNIPPASSILLFEGRELDNYDVIRRVGIKTGSKLQLTLKMNVGPFNIRKVYTQDKKNLKAAVVKARKELSKKYPDGVRVLVILHKNSAGQFQVVRIFDGIQDDHSSFDDETSLRPKSPTTAPKPSSPCKLLKYRTSFYNNRRTRDARELKVKEKDHWVIIKKLVEERKMKMKLDVLRQNMRNLAKMKREQTGSKRLTKLEKNSVWYKDSKSEELPGLCNKNLYFKAEFDYPSFMAGYYDKNELTPEMKGYKHITFRIVTERYPSRADGPAMVLNKEEHALKEKCRNKAFYMIIKNFEEEYEKSLKEHEKRIRLETDYLEQALKGGGFTVEQVADLILEFLWSGDVSYRYFLIRTGLDEKKEIQEALERGKFFEDRDFTGVKSLYKHTIFEKMNPLFDEGAASSSSMSPPFSDNNAERYDKAYDEEIIQILKNCHMEVLHRVQTKAKPIPVKESPKRINRRFSDPCKSQRGKIPVLINPPNCSKRVNSFPSEKSRRRPYRKLSDPSGERSGLGDYANLKCLSFTNKNEESNAIVSNNNRGPADTCAEVDNDQEDIESVSENDTDSTETCSEEENDQQDIASVSENHDTDSTETCSEEENDQQDIESSETSSEEGNESLSDSDSDDDKVDHLKPSNENTYRSASDFNIFPTTEKEDNIDPTNITYPPSLDNLNVENMRQVFDDPVSPFKESHENTYRRGDAYTWTTNEIASNLASTSFINDNTYISGTSSMVENEQQLFGEHNNVELRCDDNTVPLEYSFENTYRRASSYGSLHRNITVVDQDDSSDSASTIYSRQSSSTPGDSSSEYDSDEPKLVIDLEGGEEATAEDPENGDQYINVITEMDSQEELPVQITNELQEIMNLLNGNNKKEKFSTQEETISHSDLFVENIIEVDGVDQVSMLPVDLTTKHDDSSLENIIEVNSVDNVSMLPVDMTTSHVDHLVENIIEVSSVENVSMQPVQMARDLDDLPHKNNRETKTVDVVKEILLPPVEKVKRIKCSVCRRRLNITNMWNCRCGCIFCAQHRHAESHQCSFDYKAYGRELIAEQNPRVIGEKIRKI